MEHKFTTVCPKCNSNDIRKGKQDYYAAMTAGFAKSSKITHYICGDCGYVVDSFVEQPKKFKPVDQIKL